MTVIMLIVTLALIGLIAWLCIRFIPMTEGVKTVIRVAAVVICILVLLQAVGFLDYFSAPVPRLHR